MKKYLLFAALVILFLLSPYIITSFFYWYFADEFPLAVETSIEKEVDGREYCIIAPVLERGSRDWQVVNSVSSINLHHIVDHVVREKLVFFAKEGRSLRQRAKYGREMHFGVLFEKQLYIWSFKQSKLIALPFVPHRLSLSLKERYIALSKSKEEGLLPDYIDPKKYFCPYLHN